MTSLTFSFLIFEIETILGTVRAKRPSHDSHSGHPALSVPLGPCVGQLLLGSTHPVWAGIVLLAGEGIRVLFCLKP